MGVNNPPTATNNVRITACLLWAQPSSDFFCDESQPLPDVSQLRLSVIVGSGYKEQYWQVKDRWKMNHFEKETPQELENFGIDSRQFGDSIVSIPLVNFTKHTLFLSLSLNR